MDIGAVSLLFQEKGFDATMAKVAALDAAGARVGAKAFEVKVISPTAGVVQAALAGVGDIASTLTGKPVSLRLTMSGLTEVVTGLAGVEAAKTEVEAPVVIPVLPPNVSPAVAALTGLEAEKDRISADPIRLLVTPPAVEPAITKLQALTEATALQRERTAALSAALAQSGATATTTAEKAQVLRSALDADNASTEKLSTAARALTLAEQEGTEVLRLRVQATNQLIAAQNELSRAQSTGARVRAAPLTGSATLPIAVGPQLGPATPEAEAFAARSRATQAAWRAEAIEAAHAAAILEDAARAKAKAGNAATALSPKLRTAANGLTAVAFAATSMNGSMQSMALGAGLAAQSLASMASGPVAAWASGIGAAVVVGGALIGIFERMTDSAANARTAVEGVNRAIAATKDLSEAQARAKVTANELAKAQAELAREQAANTGESGTLESSMAARLFRIRTLQKAIEQLQQTAHANDVKITELSIRDTTEAEAARREIVVQSLAAENAARDAAGKEALADDQAKFAIGRASLDKFFAARLALIQSSSQREIALLKLRQATLAEPVPDATRGESAKRAAEIENIGKQITELEARTREETTRTTEERRTQREALSRAVIAFEQKEQDAAGDASEARIAAAKREATEIARTLVQSSGAKTPEEFAKAYADANERAQQFLATQTAIIRFQQAQNQSARVFADLSVEREEIQRRLERGEITAFQAQQQLAAAERARIGPLTEIADKMLVFGSILKNPDLLNAAKRLRGEIDSLARAPLGALAQRLKSVMDELSLEAGAGNKFAAQLLKEIQDAIARNGGKITIGIAVQAEWAKQLKDEIETQGALLEILIKPKNIVLSGVAQAIGQLNQELGGFALNVGNALGTALADGFSSAFTSGSGKSFFEQAGLSILAGVGGLLVQLGSAMLTYGLLMAAGLPLLLATPFAGQALSAPAAIAAGTGLIALGAGMGAIAANNTGTRTGGGGGRGASRQAQEIPTQNVVLDPDRRLRAAQEVAPRPTVNATAKAAPAQRPIVFAPTIIGTSDPKAQRDIATLVEGAVRRGLVPSLT